MVVLDLSMSHAFTHGMRTQMDNFAFHLPLCERDEVTYLLKMLLYANKKTEMCACGGLEKNLCAK